jgi:lipid-A-disaccharide synthase
VAQELVKAIARLVDRMLVLFLFEVEFYRRHGVEAIHVGHPLVDEWRRGRRPGTGRPATAAAAGAASRLARQRGARLLPPMLAALPRIAAARQVAVRIIVAPPVGALVGELAASSAQAVELVTRERFDAIADSHLALCASGTATLEVGLLGTPMIVLYRLHAWTYRLARGLVDLPNFSLVNLVLGRGAVPELLQGAASAEGIAQEALALLGDRRRIDAMRGDLAGLRHALGEGGGSARAAREVAAVLRAPVGGMSWFASSGATSAATRLGLVARALLRRLHHAFAGLFGLYCKRGMPRTGASAAAARCGTSRPVEAQPKGVERGYERLNALGVTRVSGTSAACSWSSSWCAACSTSSRTYAFSASASAPPPTSATTSQANLLAVEPLSLSASFGELVSRCQRRDQMRGLDRAHGPGAAGVTLLAMVVMLVPNRLRSSAGRGAGRRFPIVLRQGMRRRPSQPGAAGRPASLVAEACAAIAWSRRSAWRLRESAFRQRPRGTSRSTWDAGLLTLAGPVSSCWLGAAVSGLHRQEHPRRRHAGQRVAFRPSSP